MKLLANAKASSHLLAVVNSGAELKAIMDFESTVVSSYYVDQRRRQEGLQLAAKPVSRQLSHHSIHIVLGDLAEALY